jgi:hypothetical protein
MNEGTLLPIQTIVVRMEGGTKFALIVLTMLHSYQLVLTMSKLTLVTIVAGLGEVPILAHLSLHLRLLNLHWSSLTHPHLDCFAIALLIAIVT